jgi:hypothetical protein
MPDNTNNSGGKSFAERFGQKESTFTAKAAQEKKPEPTQKNFSDVTSQKTTPTKPVDPQKRMQAELIYLVKGIDAGRNAWYYVLVERLKLQLFLKALNDDIIHLENYGKILYSAYGDEPPADVTDKLKEEYGIQ